MQIISVQSEGRAVKADLSNLEHRHATRRAEPRATRFPVAPAHRRDYPPLLGCSPSSPVRPASPGPLSPWHPSAGVVLSAQSPIEPPSRGIMARVFSRYVSLAERRTGLLI